MITQSHMEDHVTCMALSCQNNSGVYLWWSVQSSRQTQGTCQPQFVLCAHKRTITVLLLAGKCSKASKTAALPGTMNACMCFQKAALPGGRNKHL